MQDLKPCPFCGSSDVELRETITDACVACNKCGCRTGLVFLGASEAANANKLREVETIWNTRTEIEHLQSQLAYTLDDWEALVRIIGENVRETDGPDRVKWDGEWHEGPLATAFTKNLRAIETMAKRNVAALKTVGGGMMATDFGPELWKAAVGFEGLYEVSDLGRVRALPRAVRSSFGRTRFHAGGVMSPCPDRDGYPRIIFRIDGKLYTRKVHRLVCEAFNGPPNPLHREVDHIDHDRANGRASNLRWVSHRQNLHRSAGAAPGERHRNARLKEADVLSIRAQPHRNAKALAAQYGVTASTIYAIWHRKKWRHLP